VTDAPLILDIGANNGATTAQFLHAFPKSTIFAFEPDVRAIRKFKNRIKDDPRVQLFEIAIGSHDHEAEFYVSSGTPPNASPQVIAEYVEGFDQSGSLRAPKSHKQVWPWVKFESKVKVPVRGLDGWAAKHGIGRVDLIWADVQGAEGDLAAGAKSTLANTRFFYTEYSDTEWYEGQATLRQLIEMLDKFVIVRRFGMDVLFKNTAL
jgi:2-O-methyltransferase